MKSGDAVKGPDAGEAPRARRSWRFRIVAVLLSLTVVLVVPELIVRAVGPTLRSYRAIQFGADPNSSQLFEQDAELHWKLRADADVEFMGTEVTTDANGFRVGSEAHPEAEASILCLGDSMPFGWGVQADLIYPQVLRDRLAEIYPDETWKVYNAGVPGHSSHQMLLRARRLIPELRPDVVVICAGTNDTSPARESDAQLFDDGGFRRFAVTALGQSDFLTWASETLRGDEEPPNPLYFERDAVSRVTVTEMLENLTAAIAIAREYGATPILLGPPSTVFLAPRNIGDAMNKWRALAQQSQERLDNGHQADALAAVDEALVMNPDDIYLTWLKGMIVWMGIDAQTGRQMLVDLFERHPFPDRARPSCRAQQEELARSLDVPYVDPNALFLVGRTDKEA
ncbi:MAG: GDSL-type esterase/lipase family protein [Planctomycetota bacterium]|nr:GDSL-type esterase/lipase family protein [Planctomycetota bacterium]